MAIARTASEVKWQTLPNGLKKLAPDSYTAAEYLTHHWFKHKVWNIHHLRKHQNRFRWCAKAMSEAPAPYCDFGCAAGHSTQEMSKHTPGPWVGVEMFAEAVYKAEGMFPGMSFRHVPSIQDIPECLQGFGGIVCSEVIEHVDDDFGLLQGLCKVASHVVALTTPSIHRKDPGHLRLYTEVMLTDLLDRVGCGESYSISKESGLWFVKIDCRKIH
jgi:2-polyprenyl-3-methyl-5-hydroxy-6-metoxy-1,4-benzoquinol methylase